MHSVIHVNTTSRLLTTLTGSLAQTKGAFDTVMQDARSAAAAQYRAHIEQLIRCMPVEASRLGDNFRIDISDAGYEAMQNNPAYEDFVLNAVRTALATPSLPPAGTATVLLQFGSDPSQFRSHSFSAGDDFFHITEEKTSYWKERMERHEKLEETNEKIADIRKRAEALRMKKWQQGETAAAGELAAASEILSLLLEEMMSSSL